MVQTLVEKLLHGGIKVKLTDGQLKINAPKGALTPSLLAEIKEQKTSLIAFLEQTQQQNQNNATIPVVAQANDYALSQAQRRLWVLNQLDPTTDAYNMPLSGAMGQLNKTAFEKAWQYVLSRHEILRTVFCTVNGEPRQQVLPTDDSRFALQCTDLSGLSGTALQERIEAHEDEERHRAFDLANGPLVRGHLLHLGNSQYHFLATFHHIIADGGTFKIFANELMGCYQVYCRGGKPQLAPLTLQYRDYAAWHNQLLDSAQMAGHRNYWLNLYNKELPVLELPLDAARPATRNYQGSSLSFRLADRQRKALIELAAKQGVSFFMLMQALVQVLLYRYSGQSDLVLGTPMAGRDHPGLQNQMGMYLNMLALRTRFSGKDTLLQLIGKVKQATTEAYAHQDYPFDLLVDELALERNLSRSPLFDVMLTVESRADNPMGGNSNAEQDNQQGPYRTGKVAAKYDLSFYIYGPEPALDICIEYTDALFTEGRIRRMAGHFQNIITTCLETPTCPLDEVPVVGMIERNQLLHGLNRTARALEVPQTLHQCLEAAANRCHDKAAVSCNDSTLTYRQLHQQANQLANKLLQQYSLQPNDLVAIQMDRSERMLVAMMAVNKAGAAYVPIDPAFPEERCQYIAANARAKLTITDQAQATTGTTCLSWDEWQQQQNQYPTQAPQTAATGNDLCYVIYTSGSTGKPKGVAVPHVAVVNFLAAMQQQPGIKPTDTLLAITTNAFDISVLELYLPLVAGAQVQIASSSTAKDPDTLIALIEQCKPTIMQATPATWQMLCDNGWLGNRRLKVLCGGEKLGTDLGERLLQRCQSLWNMFGPTEATVWATCKRVRKVTDLRSIGRPIQNTKLYVLDANLLPQPMGVPGELYIAGTCLAQGYLNRPELTEQQFVDSPFVPGELMYRTGDLCQWLENGELDILGRADHQVKVRGYRIEPGEVEYELALHPAVEQAVVVCCENAAGVASLAAYYVPCLEADAQELQAHLSRTLPAYMVPDLMVAMEALPLTPNNKVDRKALPDPFAAAAQQGATYAAPERPVEVKLAELWKLLLGVDRVGIHDNFFQLGGNSLLAVQACNRAAQMLGEQIPVATLFREPTIAGLADYVYDANSWKGTVTMQQANNDTREMEKVKMAAINTNGQVAPLFFVAPLGGLLPGTSVVGIMGMAHHMTDEQPFYNIQAPPLAPHLSKMIMSGQKPALADLTFEPGILNRVVAESVAQIKAIQPQGPYNIGGFCTGCVLAMEIAAQLNREGQAIDEFILLDPPLITPGFSKEQFKRLSAQEDDEGQGVLYEPILWRIAWFITKDIAVGALDTEEMYEELKQFNTEEEVWNHIYQRSILAGLFPAATRVKDIKETYYLKHFNSLVLDAILHNGSYAYPQIKASHCSFFAVEPWREIIDEAILNDISQLTGAKVDVSFFPGDHGAIFREENIRACAELIDEILGAEQKALKY